MRCEDFPCCGHTDEDPCERQPYDEPGYFDRNPAALYEVGSPEWYDAMEDADDYDDDEDEDEDDGDDLDAERYDWEEFTGRRATGVR